MKRFLYLFIGLSILYAGFSCGDDGDIEPVVNLGKATLNAPENNKDCNEGEIVSDTETEVTFRWTAAANSDSYTLQITNIDSGSKKSVNSNTTEAKVNLLRATSYSWYVIAKSNNSSATTQSDTWTFYNAGPPEANHVPNPATLVGPESGKEVNEGTVKLEWTGSDDDNDIASYEVYMDNSNPPTTLVGSPTSSSLDVSVTKDLTYYWQVVTIDAIGNKSTSEIFDFSVVEGDPVEPSANLVADGEMNDTGDWAYYQIWTNNDNNVEHDFIDGEYKFIGADGTAFSNAIIWQEIQVEAGKTYQFKMNARSEGTSNSWIEVYFDKTPITDGMADYGPAGMDLFIKSFGGDVEGCGNDAFDGDVFDIIKNGCALPDGTQFDSNGNITFLQSDLTSNGTIYLGIKAGNYDGNFGTGVYVDNVELKEVK